MKNLLPLLVFVIYSLIPLQSISQVTKLSNNSNINFGAALGSIGVLTTDDGSLWRTDGTALGTQKFTSKVTMDSLNAVIFGGKIYFAGKSAIGGSELWVTDGTDAGTEMVKDLVDGP